MAHWRLLNARGYVIGLAEAGDAEEAKRKWNRANVQSTEFAAAAYTDDDQTGPSGNPAPPGDSPADSPE